MDEHIVVRVAAEREGRLWVLRLEDGGVTQARHLGEIEDMVADFVSLVRGVPAGNVEVELTNVNPGQQLFEEIIAAREAQAEALRAQDAAAARIRNAAIALKDLGLTGVEIARVLGVSPQRASQITAKQVRRSA